MADCCCLRPLITLGLAVSFWKYSKLDVEIFSLDAITGLLMINLSETRDLDLVGYAIQLARNETKTEFTAFGNEFTA